MTTDTLRRDTQSFDAERNATHDARQAGAVAAGLLPGLLEATLERCLVLIEAGYYSEARALHRREIERS